MSIAVTWAETDRDITACLALRAEVFMVEQNVSEALELDGLDATARHLLAWDGDRPAGTLRIRDVGAAVKIERVCVAKSLRGRGIADALTRHALAEIAGWPGARPVKLSAQTEVVGFYERHGFVAIGPIYEDAGIPHRDMVRDPAPGTKDVSGGASRA